MGVLEGSHDQMPVAQFQSASYGSLVCACVILRHSQIPRSAWQLHPQEKRETVVGYDHAAVCDGAVSDEET